MRHEFVVMAPQRTSAETGVHHTGYVRSESDRAYSAGHLQPIAQRKVTKGSEGNKEEDRDERVEEILLSGLPDDLTIELILTKVSWASLYVLSALNRSWREEIRSRRVYETRCRINSTRSVVAIIHDHPAAPGEASTGLKTAISIYDPWEDSWRLLPSIPGVRRGIPGGCGLVCVSGRLYVLGGFDDGQDKYSSIPRDEVHVFDIGAAKGVWTQCRNMCWRRQDFPCAVSDGKILVAGGMSIFDDFPILEAEVYDPELNSWRPIAPLVHLRTSSSATVLGGEIFVHGGSFWREPRFEDDSYFVRDAGFAEIYDPSKDTWRCVHDFAQHRRRMLGPVMVVNGTLYHIDWNVILAYDPFSNRWECSQPNSWQVLKRSGACNIEASAAVTIDGEVLVVASWANWMKSDQGFTLLRSKGFGCYKRRLFWEKIQCSYSFNRGRPRMCDFQI